MAITNTELKDIAVVANIGVAALRTPDDAAEVALDEGDAGALHGDVGGGAHGDADQRQRQCRSARHFRLPIDIDEKLKDLIKHYDSTMIWVVCKLIQEDWVRSRRELSRRASDPPADAATADADDPASSTKGG